MVYIDEVEVDQEGIAEIMLDESAIAQVAREYFHKAAVLFIHKWNQLQHAFFLGCSTIKMNQTTYLCFWQDPERHWGSLEQARVEDLRQLLGS